MMMMEDEKKADEATNDDASAAAAARAVMMEAPCLAFAACSTMVAEDEKKDETHDDTAVVTMEEATTTMEIDSVSEAATVETKKVNNLSSSATVNQKEKEGVDGATTNEPSPAVAAEGTRRSSAASSPDRRRRSSRRASGDNRRRRSSRRTSTGSSNKRRSSVLQDTLTYSEHAFPHSSSFDDDEQFETENETGDSSAAGTRKKKKKKQSIAVRYAKSMARAPCLHLTSAILIALTLSLIGLIVGNFEVAVDNAGWTSRGTLIADRQTQMLLVTLNEYELFYDESGEVWEELRSEVQEGWDEEDTDRRRRQRRKLKERGGQRALSSGSSSGMSALDSSDGSRVSVSSSSSSSSERSSAGSTPVQTMEIEPSKSHRALTLNDKLNNNCRTSWYGSPSMLEDPSTLTAMWKTDSKNSDDSSSISALDVDVLQQICEAERNTLTLLRDNGLCHGCPDGECLLPYSLVLLAREAITDSSSEGTNGYDLTCAQLAQAWPSIQASVTTQLAQCADDIKSTYDPSNPNDYPDSCPQGFVPTLIDENFGTGNTNVRYTSSYYPTSYANVDDLYDLVNEMDGGSDPNVVRGAYDTNDEDFLTSYVDSILGRDMMLALGSAAITLCAMLIHTRSPWLTLMGLIQIGLSFPLAYFVYHFVGGLEFFPFLNFIGIFVVFALGADDVFVAVDKWKAARREIYDGSTEHVAALALPDAAGAMFLTSTTTAVAFFGTAICPVAPIVCFAVFCGLLIVFDYLMNIVVVFPALCLYDKWILAKGDKVGCFVTLEKNKKMIKEMYDDAHEVHDDDGNGMGGADDVHADVGGADDAQKEGAKATSLTAEAKEVPKESFVNEGTGGAGEEDAAASDTMNEKTKSVEDEEYDDDAGDDDEEEEVEEEEETPSLINRILNQYYEFLHVLRWPLLVAVFGSIAACAYVASTLTLPVSSDVRILGEDNQFELHYAWQQNLLSSYLEQSEGSEAYIVWGVTAADTGDHLNPETFSTLELDESFMPASKRSQEYLVEFCDRLFDTDFAAKVYDDYVCPINRFDAWLYDQSRSNEPDEAYAAHCGDADSVPVPDETFHGCFIAWSQLVGETSVLQERGEVRIMFVRVRSIARYDSPYDVLDEEWNKFEDWLDVERSVAPQGVNQMYHSSDDFWWYDTNGSMLRTAYGAAAIALSCAAIIVFLSSKSFVLTLFSAISIGYVLVAATACLVALGWELGFLESICFAILIGISCDFVIHFSHAYTLYPRAVSRHHRTHFALLHMGPSILAAAATTFSAAIIMLFTEITFFQKFAVILFMTIVHSTLGSFVVFLVLADCIGPSEPTKLVDAFLERWCRKKEKKGEELFQAKNDSVSHGDDGDEIHETVSTNVE